MVNFSALNLQEMIWLLILSLFGGPRKTLKESKIPETTQISFKEGSRVFTIVVYPDTVLMRETAFLVARDSLGRLKAR